MKIGYTRAMVRAALAGELDRVETRTDAFFGLAVPASVPGVPSEVLDPRGTWADKKAYDWQAGRLLRMFEANFKKYAALVPEGVRAALSPSVPASRG
jgi:phosphoenolpyruvate carboxykinase (ATP)